MKFILAGKGKKVSVLQVSAPHKPIGVLDKLVNNVFFKPFHSVSIRPEKILFLVERFGILYG